VGRLSWLKDARRLSISLTIIAAILYSYSLTQARFEIGYFGSIHSLPLSFFVALSLLTIASAILWVSPQPHGKLLGLQLGLFIIALHLTMLAIGGIGASQAGASSLYWFHGISDYIFRLGYFNPAGTSLWHLNWPAAYILNTALMLISGIDDANSILTLNIFVWILLTTSLVYLFLKSTIGKDRVNYCLAGTWLFFVANWLLYYLLPSIFGYLLLLVVMILLAQSLLQERRGVSFAYRLSLILVLVVLPPAHLLTALVALTMLLAVYVIRRAKISGLAMILAIIIASWSIYVTAAFLQWRLPDYLEDLKKAFRLDIMFRYGIPGRMIGSESHQTVNSLKVLFAALFSAIGAAGGIMALKDKENANSDKFVLATVIGMLAMLCTMGVSYIHELISRAYVFVTPAMAYFGVKLLKHKTTAIILTILLVVALPLHFISLYGNAVVDYVSPEESRGAYFFHEHTSQGLVSGATGFFPIGYIKNMENYDVAFLNIYEREDALAIRNPRHYSHYIYLRQVEVEQAIYDTLGHVNWPAWVKVRRHIDSLTNYNLIYNNPALSIYVAIYLAEGPQYLTEGPQ
jgi:hypothetical protein